MRRIKILIADDHEIIHNGIVEILRSQQQYNIVGHAYSGEEAVEMATELVPDIIFMDISMPGMNGITASKLILEQLPTIKIIALSQHQEDEYVFQILNAGGWGYLLKNAKKDEFINAISSALDNKRYLSYDLSDNLLDRILNMETGAEKEKKIHLTRREIEIIKKIADERSNQEIADEFSISLRTVETHRRNIMQKLNAKSVISLLKYANQHDLIDL